MSPRRGGSRPTAQARDSDVRADFEQRIYRRLSGTTADGVPALPPPAGLVATPATGHIRLSWDLVPGAAGYAIERGTAEHGAADHGAAGGEAPQVLRHGGSDVPAVVRPPFADTGVADDTDYTYRVAAIAASEHAPQSWSDPVTARTVAASTGAASTGAASTVALSTVALSTVALSTGAASTGAGPAAPLAVSVDAATVTGQLDRVWRMVGAERLSQLRADNDSPDGDNADNGSPAGRDNAPQREIAAEFAEALRLAHTDLGATLVRAHAILHDDNAVVRRDSGGVLHFDFSRVDAIYDQVLGLGLRPVVELSFMPAALARDPELTVFTYRGIISPPADWSEWRLLVTELAAHLVDRYGADEVGHWAFEVWNEPNLAVFWPGTQEDYLRLYTESALAVKSVDPRLRVGGPSTAASEWIELLAEYAASSDVPLDFVSTHTYGNLPLDFRPALRRHGLDGVPIWWTEWGVGSTHFGPVHDSVIGAPFVLSGFRSAQGRLDAVAYWVISDHFEELGRPPRLFHNGFGLLSVGNLRKPRYWAAHLAAHLGDRVLSTQIDGDGAEVLVEAWTTMHDDGTIDVLVWNGTINASLVDGDPRLDRRVRLTVTGLDDTRRQVWLARVDEHHSNIVAACPADVVWPDPALWARLRASDRLDEEQLPDVSPDGGAVHFDFHLPMPGIARIRLGTGRDTAWQ
jgi:xylan 1,4-beta-xylosidase